MTKRKQRNWDEAIAKVRQEAHCRFCGRADVPLETAHLLGRTYDRFVGSVARVEPDEVAPLCASAGSRKGCHTLYDHHEISLFPHVRPDELEACVRLAGREQALHRLKGRPGADCVQKPTSRRALDLGL
jgi:hypothetical protein